MGNINTTLRAFFRSAPPVEAEAHTRPSGPRHPGTPARSTGAVPQLQGLSSLPKTPGVPHAGLADTASPPGTRSVLRRSPAQLERTPINHLPCGPKIGTTANPENSVQHLEAREVHQLALALGQAAPHGAASAADMEREAVRQTLASFAAQLASLAPYDNAFLDQVGPSGRLSEAEMGELKGLMETAHMNVASQPGVDESGVPSQRLRIYFDGTDNMRDVGQDLKSALGMTGPIDQASKRLGELFAKMLAPSGFAHLDVVSGFSMGGASAQVFMAAIESRVALPRQPAVILLDPMLLNNQQAKFARKDGDLAVNYARPRGIAVTLDYAKEPHRGLMTKMKTFGGYKYPGLVQLKLGLNDHDGHDGGAPKPFPVGMGYHRGRHMYANALQRFSAPAQAQDAAAVGGSHASGIAPALPHTLPQAGTPEATRYLLAELERMGGALRV